MRLMRRSARKTQADEPIDKDDAVAVDPTDQAHNDPSQADTSSDASPIDVDEAPDFESGVDSAPRRLTATRVFTWAIAPLLVVALGSAAGYLKYEQLATQNIAAARADSMKAATDGTVALLSYAPGTVDATLGAAADRLTGDFRQSYETLVKQVVSPGSKEKQITATATIAAAASESASARHAVVLVFVNQTIAMATGTPTNTSSSVEVTLEKVDNKWLISGFDPK